MKSTIRWSEYQQLELIPASVRRHPAWRNRLQHFYQQAIAYLQSEPLQVWLTHDETETRWSARDRFTGRSIHQVSEAELRDWVEQRHLH